MIHVVLAVLVASPATPSPDRIFVKAFERLKSYPVPPYAVFNCIWRVGYLVAGGEVKAVGAYVHEYAYRTADAMELSALPVPAGVLSRAVIAHAELGPPFLPRRSLRPRSSPEPDLESGLKTIATVVAREPPPYDLTLVGIEDVDGHSTYHLRLVPARDPQRHNLRDLWIDTETFDVRQIHNVGTYTYDGISSPGDFWTRYTPEGEYWVEKRRIFTYTSDSVGDGGRVVLVSDIVMNSIAFPATLPAWLFDQRQYDLHQKAGDPDYIRMLIGEAPKAPPVPLVPECWYSC